MKTLKSLNKEYVFVYDGGAFLILRNKSTDIYEHWLENKNGDIVYNRRAYQFGYEIGSVL